MNIQIGRRVAMVLAAAACVGLGAWVSTSAAARAPFAAPPAAPVIATVDLEAIIQGMKEREDKEKTLTAKQEEFKNKIKALEEEVKNDKSKLDATTDGVDKITMAKSLREKIFRAEFEAQYASKLVGELKGEMLRELYLKINEAAKTLAKQSGYHLVMTSDEKVPVTPGDPETVLRAIAMKRMLYVDPAMDITQEVVTFLNNQYAAGGSSPKPRR